MLDCSRIPGTTMFDQWIIDDVTTAYLYPWRHLTVLTSPRFEKRNSTHISDGNWPRQMTADWDWYHMSTDVSHHNNLDTVVDQNYQFQYILVISAHGLLFRVLYVKLVSLPGLVLNEFSISVFAHVGEIGCAFGYHSLWACVVWLFYGLPYPDTKSTIKTVGANISMSDITTHILA